LPTAVRTLALFYNKDLMTAAGLDPANPPRTLDELKDQAVKCTVKRGRRIQGLRLHRATRKVRRTTGSAKSCCASLASSPTATTYTQVLWNASEGGYEAWDTFLSFERDLGTGVAGVYENDQDGFLAGEVCFHLDGSFRLGNIATNAPDLNFGVVELPEHNGIKSTFGSYWTHGITTKAAADPARYAAAVKFLEFITTPEAGKLWVGIVGELPAQLAAANDPALLADEKLGAFAAGLPYAQSTFFVDETKDRQAIIDAYDAVILTGADAREELDIAVATVQEMHDEFWSSRP
jgi:multiple sugar transport system substrate-binding protein